MGRAKVKNQLPAILLGVLASLTYAKSVTLPVVVRDHLTQKSTEIQVTGKMWDSTAGSWVGTRAGIDGLPTVMPIWQGGVTPQYRLPISPNKAAVGWPERIAMRFDQIYLDTSYQRCSATLVGPKFVLTAAHCLIDNPTDGTIQNVWVSDSFVVRPGFNLGVSATGFNRVRVVKSWVSRSKFPEGTTYPGDDDWAILELDRDVGTELGWARVVPIDYSKSLQWMHTLSYPLIAPVGKKP